MKVVALVLAVLVGGVTTDVVGQSSEALPDGVHIQYKSDKRFLVRSEDAVNLDLSRCFGR